MNTDRLQETISKINTFISEDVANSIAIKSGYIKRSTGKVSPFGLLNVLVADSSTHSALSLSSMCDLLFSYNNLEVTPQALSLRFGNKSTVSYFKSCLDKFLRDKLFKVTENAKKKGLFDVFNSIYIEDSTSCELNERVKSSFKGCGGSGSKAGYKIHTIFNATSSNIDSLDVTPSNISDQSHANAIVSKLQQNDLVIRDLGYFSISCFEKIALNEAYFISRLKTNVTVYTTDHKKIDDLPAYLDKMRGDSFIAEVDVLIGIQKFPVRLVAYLVSEEVYNKRRRKQKRINQKKGCGNTKKSAAYARYTILITNIPKVKVKKEKLCVLYDFRWQIELMFKSFKSQLGINMIKGKSKERVECFIIARLIALVVIYKIYAVLSECVANSHRREISFDKLVTWIRLHGYLTVVFQPEKVKYKVREMKNMNILSVCKQKRSRKTSREFLEQDLTIYDKYPTFGKVGIQGGKALA